MRVKGMKLLEYLRAFTQANLLKPELAGTISAEYMAGDSTPLKEFLSRRDLPFEYNTLIEQINKEFLE